MRTVWHSLAWKEWHEHKWKLASLTTILCGVTWIALLAGDTDEFGGALSILLVSIVPLSVFIGAGTASSEQSRDTMRFLQALPVPIWRVALSKVVIGALTVVGPIVLTVLALYACTRILIATGNVGQGSLHAAPLFDTGLWYLDFMLLYSLIAGSLFIWSAAAGNSRKDEVRAGAVALAVMVGWSTLLVFFANKASFLGHMDMPAKVVALSTAPGGPVLAAIVMHRGTEQYLSAALWTAALTHLLLIVWYIARWGRTSEFEIRSPQTARRSAARSDWLAPPRRTWLSAIIWKQVRESGPVVLVGLSGVAGIVALFVLPEPEHYDLHAFAQVLGGATIYLGLVVSLVVGIGVFLNDLSPQVNTFWRSRPIHPDGWYWAKLLSGWFVMLIAFSVPLLVFAPVVWLDTGQGLRQTALFTMLVPLSLYTSAVAATSLVRHAVYAAVLSIPLIYLGVLLVGIPLVIARLVGWLVRPVSGDLWQMSVAQVAAGFVISIAISTVVAWLAVRYDWGWKSRY